MDISLRPLVRTPAKAAPARPSVTPAASPRQQAYSAAIAAIQKKIDAEKALPLQKGEQTVLMAHATPPAKGTIVMYHGYSAGPWQFQQLAQKAYDDGYNVYIPRLPGHGLKNAKGAEDPSGLVKSEDYDAYGRFADSTFQDAKALGGPVSVMGLSVGGEIALAVAERHPEVQKVVAYAPFMRPKSFGWVMDIVHALDVITFHQAGKLLDLIPFTWGKESQKQTAEGIDNPQGRAGHSIFHVGNLYAAEEFGREVVANAGKIKAPVQFFTSGADDAADMGAIKQVYNGSGGASKNGFYEYPTPEGVPHAMVSPREDNGKGQTPQLYAMTMGFLDAGHEQNR
ncbi:MAG TPA: alpha/beta fold hydrolase [Oscillatoriaceae cyanobacterium]